MIQNHYDPYNYNLAPPSAPAAVPAQQVQSGNPFVYPENLPGALALMQQAVTGEAEDRMFYAWLMEQAPSAEERQIIEGIRDNEINHYALFRQLYAALTGRSLPQTQGEPFQPPADYCQGLRRALLGEQNAVTKYRKILYAMQERMPINTLTELLTVEIRHGILYSYLYAKNGCRS